MVRGRALHVHGDPAGPGRRATSHSEAETSLTRVAPAASAAAATSGFTVSTETRAPRGAASASTTGTTRASSTSSGHRLGPRPGGLAADVDDVGPLGDHLEPVGHRRARGA